MAKVSVQSKVDAPVDQVWDLIGRFNALPDWHPAVSKSELEDGGKQRRLDLIGGGSIIERLEAHDHDARTYRYSIVSGPLPVMNYEAVIRVEEGEDGKAVVHWESEFEPKGPEGDAMAAVQEIYETGFQNLKKMMGG